MSIPVDLADLARALDDAGPGYLLSTAGEQVKAVTTEPALRDGVLHVSAPGRGSLRNVAANPTVTLLFAPLESRGYTLLVDGVATTVGDDLHVVPTHAVLHRPADHAGAERTGADDTPADDTPADDTPADDTPADRSAAAHAAGSSTGCGQDCHPVR